VLEPEHHGALEQLFEHTVLANDTEQAPARRIVSQYPFNASSYVKLSRALALTGKRDDALHALNEAETKLGVSPEILARRMELKRQFGLLLALKETVVQARAIQAKSFNLNPPIG
jgi:Bacterial transcriptional activator domain